MLERSKTARGGKRKLWTPMIGLILLIALVSAAGCGAGAEGDQEITVFAASSLTDAFEEIGRGFEEQNPGTEVRFSFAASSVLLAQIRQGAPADVFAPADLDKMDEAVKEGLVKKPAVFAENRLVVVVPRDDPAGIGSLKDVARPGTRLVLAQKDVPVAMYAEEILRKAGDEYGKGFEDRVMKNVVSREANVRAAVNRVALGDADATFAYVSDVTPDIEGRVKVVEIPAKLNVRATYPIAVLKSADNPEPAERWVEFVLSEEGQRALEKWGFESARG